jgi:2-isopropylmalate synthase
MTRLCLYDTTLRDGAQTAGVAFTPADKRWLAQALDRLGIDIIEAGWPGANPADSAFFRDPPPLSRARLAAFGMTNRFGRTPADDPGLAQVLKPETPVVTLVGKSWDFHVTNALGIGLDDNLTLIEGSIAHVVAQGREAVFDAEHFFDGFKADPGFALACLDRAARAGARWVTLCDTNGGTLPHEIEAIVGRVLDVVPGERLGIHCHDDTGNAVANTLAAVRAGARQIQGTLNGLGERCGNVNLITLIPTLMLKLGYELGVEEKALEGLTALSRQLDERLNRQPDPKAPYVGARAFAHKGGLHASAVAKDSRSYEHVDPKKVGNERLIVVSDQAGRASLLAELRVLGIELGADDPRLGDLLSRVKTLEAEGYAFDGASASFELLARRTLGLLGAAPFRVDSFRVIDERRRNTNDDLEARSEATVEVSIDGESHLKVARGHGPVEALDRALRLALEPVYPAIGGVRLADYKVRILTPEDGTRAVTRVMIESQDPAGNRWSTVGVAENIIEASFEALEDSLNFRLMTEVPDAQSAKRISA